MADCSALTARFDQAVLSKSIQSAKAAVDAIEDDLVCGNRADEFKAKYAEFLVNLADAPGPDAKRALTEAEDQVPKIGDWRAAAGLGDLYFRKADRAKAFAWYELATKFVVSHRGTAPSKQEIRDLVAKTGAAKSAVSEQIASGDWRTSTRDINGKLGGIYSPELTREVEALSVPLPVRFDTDQATFTPEGRAAVAELAKAVNEQQLTDVSLVGHADPRGSAPHNMELSRRRVEAVRNELIQLNVRAHITIAWKGALEPFDASVLPYKPSQEEQWGYDRRVEWVR
jgi:outer membrane protein OmpA-like peptidoglycan-associated protein